MANQEVKPRTGRPRVSTKVHIGMRRGTRVVVSQILERYKTLWLVRCDCGAEVVSQAGNFVRNTSCKVCKKLPPGEAAMRDIMRNYKGNNRHAVFALTIEQFRELVIANCHYCGSPPSNLKRKSVLGSLEYNGIDRVDNNLGYVPGNVVTCCADCNRGKRKMTKEQFLGWVKRIYEHSLVLDA